jgi:hypothetical protein
MTTYRVVLVAVVLAVVVVADVGARWIETHRRTDVGQLTAAQRYREALRRAAAGRSGRGPR